MDTVPSPSISNLVQAAACVKREWRTPLAMRTTRRSRWGNVLLDDDFALLFVKHDDVACLVQLFQRICERSGGARERAANEGEVPEPIRPRR
jgi:hypothetical protein